MRDLPIYRHIRDGRFWYATDAISWIERNWCERGIEGCRHADPGDDNYPSGCCPLNLLSLIDETLPEIRDNGDEGLVCTAYVDARQQDGPDLFEAGAA